MVNDRRGGNVPGGWGKDELSDFIESAQHNVLASFQNRPRLYQLVMEVDAAFLRILNRFDNPPDQLAPLFFYRAHAAYRAAVRLALSGQAPETYPPLRVAIEYALLASFLNRHREKFDVWKRRSDSAEEKKKVRNEFATGTLLSDLQARDQTTYVGVAALYDECIDMGSHPTDKGVFANLVTSETLEDVHFDTQYLQHGDSPQVHYALQMCARIGVAVMRVGRLIFKERFELLGLTQELERLAAEVSKGA